MQVNVCDGLTSSLPRVLSLKGNISRQELPKWKIPMIEFQKERTFLGKVRVCERNVSYFLKIPPNRQPCVLLTPPLDLQNVSAWKWCGDFPLEVEDSKSRTRQAVEATSQ